MAQALRLMPPTPANPATVPLGLAPGSIGLSREEYKLLADSDSESEEEPEPPEGSANPPASEAAPLLQRAKESHDPGPVFKYAARDKLRDTAPETLGKELWAVDRPSLYNASFRRLKKKSSVPATKQVGRAVKQLADAGKITGGVQRAKELFRLAHFGHGDGPGTRPTSRPDAAPQLLSLTRRVLLPLPRQARRE